MGAGRLVAIDGRSGAGKSTLAEALEIVAADEQATVRTIALDGLYPGWSGLPQVGAILADLLHPLTLGRFGHYRRWDWHHSVPGAIVRVDPVDLLILEGVGAGSSSIADLTGLLVWTEAPEDVRRARALHRDGEMFAPHWDAWAADEAVYLLSDDPRTRADVVVTNSLC